MCVSYLCRVKAQSAVRGILSRGALSASVVVEIVVAVVRGTSSASYVTDAMAVVPGTSSSSSVAL